MSEKLIFWNFQILSRLQKNLYDCLSIKISGFFFIVIWSLYIDDHSYQISFSLDIPLSSYEAQHFKKMLLPPGTNRVKNIFIFSQSVRKLRPPPGFEGEVVRKEASAVPEVTSCCWHGPLLPQPINWGLGSFGPGNSQGGEDKGLLIPKVTSSLLQNLSYALFHYFHFFSQT